jgi:hypothetical protein
MLLILLLVTTSMDYFSLSFAVFVKHYSLSGSRRKAKDRRCSSCAGEFRLGSKLNLLQTY